MSLALSVLNPSLCLLSLFHLVLRHHLEPIVPACRNLTLTGPLQSGAHDPQLAQLQSWTKLLEKVYPIMSTFLHNKLFPKRRLCGKKSPYPSFMLLPTNAQGSGFLLNTQQHCFQGKGEREEPVQLRRFKKMLPKYTVFSTVLSKIVAKEWQNTLVKLILL